MTPLRQRLRQFAVTAGRRLASLDETVAEEPAVEPEPPPPEPRPSRLKRIWDKYSLVVVGALVAGGLGWISPVGSWIGGGLDGVRDFVREASNYDASQADDAKERIQGRSLWARKPDILSKSFTFLARYGDDDLVTSDSDDGPLTIEPEDAVNNGLAYDGRPVVLIGKALNSVTLASGFGDAHDEQALASADGKFVVYVGVGDYGSTQTAKTGRVVAYRGVITALGVAKASSEAESPTAYFTATADLDYFPIPKDVLKRFGTTPERNDPITASSSP